MRRKRTNTASGHKRSGNKKDLGGFEISINSFGEIHSNIDINTLNEFLNRNLEDKKLNNPVRKESRKSSKKK